MVKRVEVPLENVEIAGHRVEVRFWLLRARRERYANVGYRET